MYDQAWKTVARGGVVQLSLLAFLSALLALPVLAQTDQGSIAGNVLDPTGALVAGAKVTAKGAETGTVYETVSSSAGTYRISNMRIGVYNLTAMAAGFKTAQLNRVAVQVGTVTALDVKLQTGAVNETVEVLAESPSVQSESVDIGHAIGAREDLGLPLPLGGAVQFMRSPESFVFTLPGTAGPGTAGVNSPSTGTNGGTFESKISGGQAYGTEVLLDGASIFRSENGSSFDETAPSVDAISDFKITTSTYPAEMGHTTGGIESFSTKQGTNSFHGVAYEMFRNNVLDSNTWLNRYTLATNPSANHSGLQTPDDKQNDYGFTFGGPVIVPHLYNGKDKTFFFFSWEQFRTQIGGVTTSTVPTLLERTGDFSQVLNTGVIVGTNPCGGNIFAGQIFDPATDRTGTDGLQCRLPFAGNKITTPLSAVGQKMMALYPTPTNGGLFNNYVFPFSYPVRQTSMSARFDQNLSSKSKLYFTYNSRDNTRLSTNPQWNNFAGAGRFQDFFTHYIRIGDDYSITPTMLNHLSLGYNRTNSKNIGAGMRSGTNWADALGISGTPAAGAPFTVVPVIGMPAGSGLAGTGDTVNGDTVDNGFRGAESLEWIHGKHDFKFGADIRHQQYSPLDFSNTPGTYNFAFAQTAGSAATSGLSGNPWASMLLGQVNNANVTAPKFDQARWLSGYYGVFFQDNFKITPTLTLSYGLRWDLDLPRKESDDNTSNIDITKPNPGAGNIPGVLVFAGKGSGRNGVVGERWANVWKKDFGPRIGVAWSPSRFNGKTVFRGGYGVLYGALQYADFGGYNRQGFSSTTSKVAPNLNPAFVLDSGFPGFNRPPSLDPTQWNNGDVQYLAPEYGRPPMVQNWSVQVQHELASDLILDMAYVGSHGTHLHTNFDFVNSLNPKYFNLGDQLNAPIGTTKIPLPYANFDPTLPVNTALRPFPQYRFFNTDGELENLGQSTFNALEVSLKRRFRNGLNLMASYTWEKTLTDADDSLPFFATLHGGGSVQNAFDLNGEKAVSNQDVPHTLVVSYIYELPVGKGKRFLNKGGALDKVVGGWQVSGIQRYQSGQPLSFCCATGIPGYQGAIRFNLVPGQPIFSDAWRSGHFNPTTDSMFNPKAFSDPNGVDNLTGIDNRASRGGSWALGTMPRTLGSVRMNHFFQEDFNLMKRFFLGEKKDILFQASAFNTFNRVIWDRPGTTSALPVNRNSFGFVNPSAPILAPRKLQLELKLEF